jgi:signal transduction histidine kinase
MAGPHRRLNQIFGLYTLAITGWALEEAFLVGASTQAIANIIWPIGWSFVLFIAPTFLHTALLCTEAKDKTSKYLLITGYFTSAIFFILQWVYPMLLTGPPRPVGYTRFHHAVTPLGVILPLTFLVFVNVALWRLWRGGYKEATGQRKTQLKYLFWSSVIGYLGGSPSWFFTFGFHLPFISPFGIYGVPCYSLAMAYAIFQHRLFDVNLVIRKSLVYSLIVSILTMGYFGSIYVIERVWQVSFGYRSLWFSIVVFAIMTVLFQPLKVGIQRFVDLLFFRAPHEELVKRMERLEQEVRQADKLRAVSTLATGMAHEIKNPLTSIKTFTSYLSERGSDPAFQQKFQQVVTQEVDRIDQIVRRLLEFAKPAPPQLEPTTVSRLLDETLDFLTSEALRRRVEIERAYEDTGAIEADPQQLKQAFLNLFLNSLEAMNGSGGTLAVATGRNGSRLTVTIRDTGQGIPKEHLGRIFDPFFTTKSHGTGLGLSIVQGIITEHHGTITFASDPNHGTTCTLTFPLATVETNS